MQTISICAVECGSLKILTLAHLKHVHLQMASFTASQSYEKLGGVTHYEAQSVLLKIICLLFVVGVILHGRAVLCAGRKRLS